MSHEQADENALIRNAQEIIVEQVKFLFHKLGIDQPPHSLGINAKDGFYLISFKPHGKQTDKNHRKQG
ncbi:MAG: hypothetical protein IKI11_05495 [Neisseriaceae bacterium]|nr:hypothetical protein [Neisseriaceae bacterium]